MKKVINYKIWVWSNKGVLVCICNYYPEKDNRKNRKWIKQELKEAKLLNPNYYIKLIRYVERRVV